MRQCRKGKGSLAALGLPTRAVQNSHCEIRSRGRFCERSPDLGPGAKTADPWATPRPRRFGARCVRSLPAPPPLPPPAPGLSWAPGCCRWPSGGRPAFPRDRRGSVRAGLRGAPRGGMRVRLSWASPGEEAASPGGGVRGPDRSRLPRPVAKTSGPSRQTPVAGPYFATPSQRAASGSRSPPPALERSAAERSGAAPVAWRGVAWHGTAVSVSAPRAGPPRCPPAPLPLPPGPPRPLPRAPL